MPPQLKLPIYLDCHSTTPLDPRVLEAMTPYFTEFYGNAASKHHALGRQAHRAVEAARDMIGQSIHARPQDICFTSGATESVNLAIKGLFHAGGEQPMAVPLGLVARLEDIPRDKIEMSCGAPVTQYRGKLMPLVALSSNLNMEKPRQSVLVFNDHERSMGLMVDEIVDVVEDLLNIELSGARPGLLGTAVIAGHATDVIDTGYWLTQAWKDWFHGAAQSHDKDTSHNVLVVEDSNFFRQLLAPILDAAGYRVTTVASAAEALRLRDAGTTFDVVVSDIEMPDMDGLDFARAVRADGAWTTLPMIALSAHAEPRDIEAGRDAGFTDYVAKFEREALIASLRQCLGETVAA